MDSLVKEQVGEIKSDVSKIREDISEIKVTMGINTASLETHIKRTDALQEMAEEFKSHMLFVNTSLKLLGALGAVILFLDQLGLLGKLF